MAKAKRKKMKLLQDDELAAVIGGLTEYPIVYPVQMAMSQGQWDYLWATLKQQKSQRWD